MGDTTMNAMHNAEQTEERRRAGQAFKPVLEALRNVWWFGLGTAVVIGEQGGRLANALVSRGRQVEPAVGESFKKAEEGMSHAMHTAGGKLKDFGGTVTRGTVKMGGAVDEKMTAAMEKMGIPNRLDLEELNRKLDALTQKVEELRTRHT